ncbi:hypothetical protein VTK56DRAFT_3026 [Thermocarpiscus australiensis]
MGGNRQLHVHAGDFPRSHEPHFQTWDESCASISPTRPHLLTRAGQCLRCNTIQCLAQHSPGTMDHQPLLIDESLPFQTQIAILRDPLRWASGGSGLHHRL